MMLRLLYTLRKSMPLLFLFIASFAAKGQTGRLFTVDSELSSSLVIDIHQDRSGFIWIATGDGLTRFDGITFNTYRQDRSQRSPILSNITRAIAEDADGRMYVGYINGLQYYDSGTDQFHTIPLLLWGGRPMEAHVQSIYQRKNGQLLVGTSGYGLFEVVLEDGRWVGKQRTDIAASGMVVEIFEDSRGVLWVSTEDHGLFRFEGNDRKRYFESRQVQNNVISSIVEDNYGTLWVGSSINGLFKYNAAADTFYQVPCERSTGLRVSDVLVSRENRIYAAVDGGGVKYVDQQSGKLVDMELSVATFRFSKAKVNSILEDRDGNIWMGIYQKGIFMVPTHRNNFRYMGYKSVNRNLIGSNSVMAIFEDSEGAVWVGTDNDGLYRVDPGLGSSKHYPGGDKSPSTVMTIFEDSDRNLWVGSYDNGLAKFDRKSGAFSYPVLFKDTDGANVQRIFYIEEDDHRRLWVATMGSGLFRLDLDTYETRQYTLKERDTTRRARDQMPNDWINCTLLADNRKLFMGTYDGLGCLDLESESFLSTFDRDNKLFRGEVIYALYDDQRGNLWVGSSEGLRRVKLATMEVSTFDVDDGLPSNVIWSIEGDKRGALWLSTNRGLVKMDVREQQFLNFHSGDGLQGDEFMRGVSLQSRGGMLFFGGLHGVSYFYPNDIRAHRKNLAVHLVDFYIHDKPVTRGMKSGRFDIIDTAVTQAEVFQLANRDNSFTLEFSTMDFSDSERTVFEYSMNGNEWVSLRSATNRITFEDFNAGTHELRVRAATASAFSDIKKVTIVVHPVWYLSGVAKAIYLVVVLLIGFVVFRMAQHRKRIRHRMLAHERQEEINEAKLQFFINIAHEIRTPLTLIVGPLKRLMGSDNDRKSEHLYEIMERNVHRITDLVSQLMDIRKIEKGLMTLTYSQIDIVRYIQDVCDLFEEQFDAKDIRFRLKCTGERMVASIDPRNFDKILVNILSNACKFTPVGGWIEVELSYTEDNQLGEMLTISVADSGQQIDEQHTERIFECFYQSDSHRDYNSSGRGIGLYLAKQLMELHGGSIRAENLQTGGCRFVMTLPPAVVEDITVVDGQTLPKPNIPYQVPASTQPIGKRKRRAKNVLVVDDDPDILAYLCSELDDVYNVSTCSTGKAAYTRALTSLPDLILSDIMMPDLDGLSLCAKLRNNPNTNHIPVVLLTAKTDESDNLDGLDHGADAYITKPFSIDLLLKTIERTIKNRDIVKNGEYEQTLQKEHISTVSIKSPDEKLLEKVYLFIENNLDNPSLSVEMISSEIGISRVHLHRKLKELTSLTTRDLIRSTRLKQAAQLLMKKSMSVSEVAYAVGYTDLSNFSVSFKQAYGVSPSMYAAQSLENNGAD